MNNQESDLVENFNDDARYIVYLLEECINQFGCSDFVRDAVNDFFDTVYIGENGQIKRDIGSIYMAFLGKTNFRDKSESQNIELHKKLLVELADIKSRLK